MEINKTLYDGTQIRYTESFWTGSKTLAVNGKEAQKVNRKTFRSFGEIDMSTGCQPSVEYVVKGNYIAGVKLETSTGGTIVLSKNTWYDWLFIVLAYVSIVLGAIDFGLLGGILSALLGSAVAFGVIAISRSKMSTVAKVLLELLISLAPNILWGGLLVWAVTL